MKFSIIIPAYNEEENIGGVLNDIRQNFQDEDYEVIVVDDCSSDKTVQIVKNFGGVRLISHTINKGYGASIKRGIKEASGEFIITMDADGQHKAEEAKKLLAYIDRYDLVVGSRRFKDCISWRTPGRWLLKKISEYLIRQKIPDINCGLRVFKKSVMKRYLYLCSDRFSFSTTSLLAYFSDGREVKFVEIVTSQRKRGRSRVRLEDGLTAILVIIQVIMVFNPLRIFLSISLVTLMLTCGFIIFDLVTSAGISDTSVLLMTTTLIIFIFGLLADQVSKIRKELISYR